MSLALELDPILDRTERESVRRVDDWPEPPSASAYAGIVGDFVDTVLAEAARWKCRPVSVASYGKVVGVSTRSPMQK